MSEPAEELPFDSVEADSEAERPPSDSISLFSLSGGIMKQSAKTANRIDGLLSRMILEPRTGRYVADVDKNLDFLFTSLQLDMIGMVAENSADEPEEEPTEAPPPEPVAKTLLGSPFHDES